MISKKIFTIALAIIMCLASASCIAEVNTEKNVVSDQEDYVEDSGKKGDKPYRYKENDGIFVFYETENEELYRRLLPEVFDMPDELLVHLFVMDFYKIDSDAEPYKEMSISLLAKHNGEDIWHCIYMPVTSRQSMLAGKYGLGLPKTMGDIEFERGDSIYTGSVIDDQKRSASISLDTNGYSMSESEESQIKSFMSLPKLNILNGEIIQMTRSGGTVNIIDVAKRYPKYVRVEGAKATLSFDSDYSEGMHPFDLEPSKIVGAYYLHNEIPFSLDRK